MTNLKKGLPAALNNAFDYEIIIDDGDFPLNGRFLVNIYLKDTKVALWNDVVTLSATETFNTALARWFTDNKAKMQAFIDRKALIATFADPITE